MKCKRFVILSKTQTNFDKLNNYLATPTMRDALKAPPSGYEINFEENVDIFLGFLTIISHL